MDTMLAARLYGPRDMRIEEMSRPGRPGAGQALLRVGAVGICGSDLHVYTTGRIGDLLLGGPLILGHEFGGFIEEVGPEARDGNGQPLRPGTPVAVDPAEPCGHCRQCAEGHPNLCPTQSFRGLYPRDGAMCQRTLVRADACFPVPPGTDMAEVTLMETMGVALHTVDLAHIHLGDRVAVLGAGPVGLCILQAALLAGAGEVWVTDRLPWRLDLARKLGGKTADIGPADAPRDLPAEAREFDVAIEAAWAGPAAVQAAEIVRPGGRVVLAGIPDDDRLELKHSTARRKGLTIRLVRRMKHVYPRVLRLYVARKIDLGCVVSHRFGLAQAARAMEAAARYDPGVVKVVVTNET
jgi:L-iditol 2-dehydrogenase